MDKTRFLKSLVIALGIAVFVALAFVVYGIVGLATRPDATAVPARDMGQAPERISLNLDSATEIVAASAIDESLIAITVRTAGRGDRILVVDRSDGRIVQTIFAHGIAH